MKISNSLLFILYYIVGIVIILMIITSCSSVKRVLSDPAKLEKVGRVWERANGCTTSTIVLEGVDSIRIDTVYNNDFQFSNDSVTIDTLNSVVTKTIIRKVPVYITKTIKRVDTFNTEDVRRVNLLTKDISYRDGQIVQLTKEKKEERQRGNKYMWLFIGAISLSVLVAVYKMYRKFKK